jgi:S1-C subfamily serine protease
MNRLLLLAMFILPSNVATYAETESIDLKALAKKARPAVMLLVVSDSEGNEIASGTGFLVSADGKLITNRHVIENGANVVAKAENGGLFGVAGVIAKDSEHDLVLLKVTCKDLPNLALGSSEKVEAGTRIAVIGSPLGLEGTLSEGIISAVRDEPAGKDRWIQISAPVSHGSSGSPVLNSNGEVIGVATLLIRSGQMLNFAIPVEVAKELLRKAASETQVQPFVDFAKQNIDDLLHDPNYKAALLAILAGDNLEALTRMKAVYYRFPDNSQAIGLLSAMLTQLYFSDDEISILTKQIQANPKDAELWIALGEAYRTQGRFSESIGAWKRVLSLNPDHPMAWVAWNEIGYGYFALGMYKESLDATLKAVDNKSNAGVSWCNLALSYAVLGQQDDAMKAFKKLQSIDPNLANKFVVLLRQLKNRSGK